MPKSRMPLAANLSLEALGLQYGPPKEWSTRPPQLVKQDSRSEFKTRAENRRAFGQEKENRREEAKPRFASYKDAVQASYKTKLHTPPRQSKSSATTAAAEAKVRTENTDPYKQELEEDESWGSWEPVKHLKRWGRSTK